EALRVPPTLSIHDACAGSGRRNVDGIPLKEPSKSGSTWTARYKRLRFQRGDHLQIKYIREGRDSPTWMGVLERVRPTTRSHPAVTSSETGLGCPPPKGDTSQQTFPTHRQSEQGTIAMSSSGLTHSVVLRVLYGQNRL